VSFIVTNAGNVSAGAEVAQLYLTFPDHAGEPPSQLKGFHKTAVLSPGASEVVVLPLRDRDVSIFDAERMQWQVVPGKFGVWVGASSRDLRLAGSIDS
jgi:beta-glucosidase